MVRRSTVYVGNDREASGHAVLVHGRAPKVASFGSCDMYSFALRGKGHGATVYDSFDLEAVAKRVV